MTSAVPDQEFDLNLMIEANPRSVSLNIQKGDSRAQAGDLEVACYFYRRAIQFAREVSLAAEEDVEIRGAELAHFEAARRLREKQEGRLTQRGLPEGQWSPRLRSSLQSSDIRWRGIQDPTHHYYEGLPDIEFYDAAQFAWASAVEAATHAIREELIALLESAQEQLRPFTPNDVGLPMGVNKKLRTNSDWGVLTLCEQGWLTPENIERCPITWQTLLAHAPVPRVAGWGPSALFSLLKAGAHIGAHTGMYNSRLICHLPLIVPSGGHLRVGDEVREWQEGKLLIFNDSIEHEAWNASDEDRVVLIFDIWRPELTETERYELRALFSD